MSENIRIVRIVEYFGPADWVQWTVAQSVQGTKAVGPGYIRAITIGEVTDQNLPFELFKPEES